MQLDSKNRNRIFIGVGIIAFALIVFFIAFGITEIKTIGGNSFSVDGKTKSSPWSGYLLIGSHNILVREPGHKEINENIKIHPGLNKFSFTLKNIKTSFIEKMPLYTDEYDADYNKEGDFFFVVIKIENTQLAKQRFLSLLKEGGLKPDEEKIIWDYVAGVNGRSGP